MFSHQLYRRSLATKSKSQMSVEMLDYEMFPHYAMHVCALTHSTFEILCSNLNTRVCAK
jgi:hypothetical protein